MLKTLRLHNFKTFLNTEINFTQRHLIIGKNNSGKTNLCAAFQFLKATVLGDLSGATAIVPGGVAELSNWTLDSNTVEFGVNCEIPIDGDTCNCSYEVHLEIADQNATALSGQVAARVCREELSIHGPHHPEPVFTLSSDGQRVETSARYSLRNQSAQQMESTKAPKDATMLSKLYDNEANRFAVAFRTYLASWGYLVLSPNRMRYGWRDSSPKDTGITPRGENLAVALFHLKNYNERTYRRVLKHVRRIEPSFEAVNFIASPDQVPVPFVELSDRERASWVGLSDGTLRWLALAYVVETVGSWKTPEGGPVGALLVVEEPENGLFPGAIRALLELFEERAPAVQVLFTSHSPYFINLFDGFRESVTHLRRNKERTEIRDVPAADDNDPDRELLAEQYSMELFG